MNARTLIRGVYGGLAGGAVFGAMMGMMGMLPMIGQMVGYPNAAVGFALHMVNSAYQQRMLSFVESHTDRDTRLAVDYYSASQFIRYFGSEAGYRQGLYQPLHWRRPVDPAKVRLFLLHWPGPAGGLGEQVEYRSSAMLTALRDTPGWGLIYDNGESFVLRVR